MMNSMPEPAFMEVKSMNRAQWLLGSNIPATTLYSGQTMIF